MSNIYNSKFVSAVRSILVVACADGARISREEICERLSVDGIDVTPAVIKVAMDDGAFNSQKQAWALFAGRFGGIRELDLAETAKAQRAVEERQAKWEARTAKRLATLAANRAARKNVSDVSVIETQASV